MKFSGLTDREVEHSRQQYVKCNTGFTTNDILGSV